MRMKDYLRLHKKNRTRIRKAITTLNRALNSAIRRHEDESASVQVRCLILLWIAYFETSLNCIVHSANQLSYDQRRTILARQTLLDRWQCLLDICFRMYYLSPKKRALSRLNLGSMNFHRYTELSSFLKKRVAPMIEVRNRLAHGQWHIAFNNGGTSLNQDLTSHIWRLSKKDVIYAKALTHNLVALLTELTCSRASFENKYDDFAQRIEEANEYAELRFQSTMDWLEESQAQKERLGFY